MIEIFCTNTNTFHSYPLGSTLRDIANNIMPDKASNLFGALINHRVKSMDYEITRPRQIYFFDFKHPEGRRMYFRSLCFVLYVASKELYPEAKLRIDHSIPNGYYCELNGLERDLTNEDIWQLKEEMMSLIAQALPFERKSIRNEHAIEIFERENLTRKAELFQYYGKLYAPVDNLKSYHNFFFGHLLPNTSFIQNFELKLRNQGLAVILPKKSDINELNNCAPQKKLFDVIQEHKNWAKILGVNDVAKLNSRTRKGRDGEIVKIAEALQERKIAQIAIAIQNHPNKPKIILIAGPSSSGKTTFSKRLAIQLKVSGLRPHLLSMDDYFVSRVDTPLDENGEYNFEALEAVDIPYFNQQLSDLLQGKAIEPPRFDFVKGERINSGETLKLKKKDILIVEGIHALNPALLDEETSKGAFRIFISALTQISLDEHNYVSSADTRFIRRIIRDFKYRNYAASDTIERWPSVRRGEEQYIFPHQENADVMFNSALLYELGAMKSHVEPLLKQIKENQPEYTSAIQLLNFISYFDEIEETEIPPTSILREFLGGSSFE